MPPEIWRHLDNGAVLMTSISGGKDSQAMSLALVRECQQQGWAEPVFVHCGLGAMEWSITSQVVEDQAKGHDLVVLRKDHDLLEGIQRRMEKRPDAPPFPSSAARYCTAGWKREVTDSFVRRTYVEDVTVIVAQGIRADESPARAKKPIVRERTSSAPTKNRLVLDWYPIFHWSEDMVWSEIYGGYNLIDQHRDLTARWVERHEPESVEQVYTWLKNALNYQGHPAYALGNQRLSCALCVLASRNDLMNGARWNPHIYQALVDIELQSGFTFTQKTSLKDLMPEHLRPDQREQL